MEATSHAARYIMERMLLTKSDATTVILRPNLSMILLENNLAIRSPTMKMLTAIAAIMLSVWNSSLTYAVIPVYVMKNIMM